MRKTVDHYFVITAPGFEDVCARELLALEIQPAATIRGGVGFTGGLPELYRANLWLRSATRVLVRLGEATARDFPVLFQRLSRLAWGRFIKPGTPCDIRVVSRGSRLNHTGRIAEVCEAAIAKSLGTACRSDGPKQKVFIRMNDDRCQVSIDSSGDHLHRRGYRKNRVAAHLRETLAAGCLLACHYDGSSPLFDVMTGSGTLAIEAALIALNRAPGKGRDFAFMDWPRYRHGLWQQLLVEAQREEKSTLTAPVLAVDNNSKAVAAAQQNLEAAGVNHLIQLSTANMQQLQPEAETGLLICNPPYGERLGKNASLKALYHDLGRVYGQTFSDWEGAVICPEGELIKSAGIPFFPLLKFTNGGIKVALLKKS